MIYILLNENLTNYEADIRDLVMAFYPYHEYNFLYGQKENINYDKDDIIISDFYNDKIYDTRFETKNHIKRALYKYLQEKNKISLPWGTLTGIRPVNILTEGVGNKKFFLDNNNEFIDIKNDNYDVEKVKKYLKEEYLVSDEKICGLIDIANNERKILKRENLKDYKKRCSVYVGIPFCKTTCLYCSFTSYSIDKYNDKVYDYLDALDNEINEAIMNDEKKENKDDIKNPLTLYVGGGTPTSLSEEQFEKFLCIMDKHFNTKDRNDYMEYTIEAGRPDTITEKKLLLMKEFGVTRISINPQTFNQKTLDLIGRKHKVEDVIEKYYMARSIGFDNINMDIILGFPKENIIDVEFTLNKIFELKPDNITVHSLALKRAARLNYELDSWIDNLEEENINIMFLKSKILTQKLNQKPYYLYRQKNIKQNLENVGYSIEGKECIYNIIMMGEKHTIYGFGCGGVGKKVEYINNEKIVTRMKGTKSLVDYINRKFD